MMAAPTAVVACNSSTKSGGSAQTEATEGPGTAGGGSGGDSGDTDTSRPTADAEAIFAAADTMETDLARAFAATPFESLATRATDALRTVAAACEGAPEALSHQVRTTVEGAIAPLAAWTADFVTTDDPTLDTVEADIATLTATLEVHRRAIADAWTALRSDPGLAAELDGLGPLPDLAGAIQPDMNQLKSFLFTEGGWDIPQVQRVVMMQEWLVGTLHDGVDLAAIDRTFAAGPPPPPTDFDISDCERFKQADSDLGMILGNPTNADASLFYLGHLAMGLLAVSIGMALLLPAAGVSVLGATLALVANLMSLATIAMAAVASSIITVAASCECE